MKRIYLDYNASTPLAPEVREAMLPYLDEAFGNPMSGHWAARPAREAIDRARRQVAHLIGADTSEIVFTSGGSEANNTAIKGVVLREPWERPPHVIVSSVEHPAVMEPCHYIQRLGAAVTFVQVDTTGRVNPDDVERAMRPETQLVSVMLANNEVGTIQPVAAIARIARDAGVAMHTDAAQAVGKIPVDVRDLGVDLLTIAGHKLYGPKGVGTLYVRSGFTLEPLFHGGAHEGGLRAGTENTLLIAGLGAACEVAEQFVVDSTIRALRDRFWANMEERFRDQVVLNGHPDERLPNTLSVSFPGRIAADLLAALEGVAASTGSACHEGSVELSGVLAAMGVPAKVGMGAVRFSLGRASTWPELEHVLGLLESALSGTMPAV